MERLLIIGFYFLLLVIILIVGSYLREDNDRLLEEKYNLEKENKYLKELLKKRYDEKTL